MTFIDDVLEREEGEEDEGCFHDFAVEIRQYSMRGVQVTYVQCSDCYKPFEMDARYEELGIDTTFGQKIYRRLSENKQ